MASNEPIPIDLTEVLRVGAIYQGKTVLTLALTWDGGEFSTTLAPADESDGPTRTQKKIIEALEHSPVPLTRKQLAKCIGLKNAKGRFSLVVSTLVETGEILERDGMVTNDASKNLDD